MRSTRVVRGRTEVRQRFTRKLEVAAPRFKFKWSNLLPVLFRDLSDALLEIYDPDAGPADALRTVYGARPTVEFVREAWPTLRESWLRSDKESRHRIVDALQKARNEHGLAKGTRAQMTYLRNLRNSKTLRDIVGAELIEVGEVDRHDEPGPRAAIDTAATTHRPDSAGRTTPSVPDRAHAAPRRVPASFLATDRSLSITPESGYPS